ncbi:MAG: glycoside hydrolase family 75 protein [Desulfovibrionaceae bacterium]|nr:glycoside hydrolase family 75 protein [Desulfovibrionaceae bacterium]
MHKFNDGEIVRIYKMRKDISMKSVVLWFLAIFMAFSFLVSTASFGRDFAPHDPESTERQYGVDVAMNQNVSSAFSIAPQPGLRDRQIPHVAKNLSAPTKQNVFFQRIGSSSIYNSKKHSSVYMFKAGMHIDADGSFSAYHPLPGKGLDHLGNAGRPGNWWGIVTHNAKRSGKPVLQVSTDPAPGYYVSGTSLQDATKRNNDPTRYVNSEAIPFFVLPGDSRIPATMGDFGYVVNMDTAMSSGCIFADVGPDNKIGEGSIALARAVGIPSDPKGEGTTDQMIYVVFTDTSQGWPVDKKYIDSHSNQLFEQWGGMERLRREMY